MPDSFTAGYLFPPKDPNNYALILPTNPEQPLLMGVKGKEKPLAVLLTPKQMALLLGLAAHSRGFEFANVAENISFHPFGWVDVVNNAGLKAELMQLAALFKSTDVYIENHQDRLFRLSINPSMVYFDETLFTFSVHNADLTSTKTKIWVTIARIAIFTAFGMIQANSQRFKVTLDFAYKLRKLFDHRFSADNKEAEKIADTYKKGLHKEPDFLILGLRSLIRSDAGIMTFCCQFVVV